VSSNFLEYIFKKGIKEFGPGRVHSMSKPERFCTREAIRKHHPVSGDVNQLTGKQARGEAFCNAGESFKLVRRGLRQGANGRSGWSSDYFQTPEGRGTDRGEGTVGRSLRREDKITVSHMFDAGREGRAASGDCTCSWRRCRI